MRAALLVIAAFVAACGGDTRGKSLCDNVVPPPLACMTECDATPGAPATCPGGYHCTEDGRCDARCSQGGSECGDGYRCTPEGRCVGTDECVGLECRIVNCEAQGKPQTSISGTVFAPNGTLPLYGIDVYVPNVPVGPPQDGAICDRCSDSIPGYPLSRVQSDTAGNFTLLNVPAGQDIPVIIQSGKWRREITIPQVTECTDNALPAGDARLPRTKMEGSMPKIAISTGSADALECLVRKLGIADSELTTDAQGGMINLFTDGDAGGGEGTNRFEAGFAGGSGDFPDSQTLWNTTASLSRYDIVILSCEGAQHPETKSQAAMDALKAYADLGGRVFLSHWHNIWIEGSTEGGGNQTPEVWPSIATWTNGGNLPNGSIDVIDEVSNPKGPAFADWMLNVMGSTTRGEVVVNDGRTTVNQVDQSRGERWTYVKGGAMNTQNFQFTTPNEASPDNRCGKVVFSDMHVSGDSQSSTGTPFPDGCASGALTPQEKALAFMFFDIASCIQPPIL